VEFGSKGKEPILELQKVGWDRRGKGRKGGVLGNHVIHLLSKKFYSHNTSYFILGVLGGKFL
jgi:hypothetical protein